VKMKWLVCIVNCALLYDARVAHCRSVFAALFVRGYVGVWAYLDFLC
jgi:hypothetical protein